MSSIQTMDENCKKLVQIYHLIKNSQLTYFKIEAILKNDFSVNYKLPSNACTNNDQSQYLGNTALHFMAEFDNFSFLDSFIKYGADLTIQNFNDFTPLLLAFHNGFEVDKLISVHIKNEIFTNMKDKNGLSHFHVACSTKHIEAVDGYLEAGSSVEECVNNNASKYAGYTPLHFAALHGQLQIIKFLLAHGANINSKDVIGTSPLHLLIKKCNEPKFDHQLFLQIFSSSFLPDDVGLTNFHLNCTLNYPSLFKRFLNQDVDVDSPIQIDSPVWPGYTPLHVASQFNLSTVILLLEKGANLLAKDASGTTPFDLCLKKYKLNEIIQILSAEKRHRLSQIKFTDGTCLIDALCAINNREIEKFINEKIKNVNTFIPFNSLLWPGCNLLHLAVILEIYKYCAELLLSCNVDFTMINADSMSPLHLAFYLNKKYHVDIILKFHEKIRANPIDRDNLSHLHIACVEKNLKVVESLLSIGSDLNLPLLKDVQYTRYQILHKIGTTPFDIAVSLIDDELMDKIPSVKKNDNDDDDDECEAYDYCNNIMGKKRCEILIDNQILKPGINAFLTSKITLKILNRALVHNYETNKIYTKIVDKLVNEMRFKELGLTKLQVACALGKLAVVKEELESGASVNQQIAFDSSIWPGDTALHVNSRRKEFASRTSRIEIAQLLLEYGANPNIKNVNNLTPVHLSNNLELEAVLLLSTDKFPIVNAMNNDGLSHFHLSCKTSNVFLVEEFIKSGVNINTPVNYFADLYAGYAPLHFAVHYGSKEVIKLLLSHGADPNIKTADDLTPFYLAVSQNSNQDQIEALLSSPIVDIQSTDLSNKPVLFKVLENIASLIKSNNLKTLAICESIINLFCNKGIRIDFADLIAFGNLQKMIKTAPYITTPSFQRLINNVSNITDVDKENQNIMHYFYFSKYDEDYSYSYPSYKAKKDGPYFFQNFDLLIRSGCEINHKDNKGKTPLHKAVQRDSEKTVDLLLSLGADVNIKDDKGKTPLFYANEKTKEEDSEDEFYGCDVEYELLKHIYHLMEVGLYIDESNEDLFEKFGDLDINPNDRKEEKQKWHRQLKKDVHPSLSLGYFFSKQFEVDYRRMSVLQRQAICNICESDNLCQEYPKMHNLIRLQFRKARSRIRLFEPAMTAFQALLDIIIPKSCLQSILKYLNNDDIMNLVRSGHGKLVFAPLPENY